MSDHNQANKTFCEGVNSVRDNGQVTQQYMRRIVEGESRVMRLLSDLICIQP